MIYVPYRPYVHVRLRPLKYLFSHACFILLSESSVPPQGKHQSGYRKLEPTMGFEPMTPFLPRTCSTG